MAQLVPCIGTLMELNKLARTVLHKFQSTAWYKHIASCVALPKLIVRES